ncbi:MAG TPA: flavodoxin domain-containing protein, partial [Candidatus Limnocylindrales bacterium]|nr:flavodoxin domain-containing protein [Candidatus Limnocylindrales bacterium]
MNVSIVYATRHGATRDIAERIGGVLRGAGLDATVGSTDDPFDPRADAYVVGSAVYIGSWLKDATAFVRRNAAILATRPVWLFSSGPLGTALVDRQGHDVLADPKPIAEVEALVHPRRHRVFFGAYDPSEPPAALSERIARMTPVAKELLVAG